ncbi:MAG: ABC transporter substrate-binding protein [Phormidesmis sp.]
MASRKVAFSAATFGIIVGLSSCGEAASDAVNKEFPENATVTILGQFSEEDQQKFEQALLPFEEETGIDVIYESADNFNSLLRMRIASFYKPDLAIIPQPGLIADLVADDHLVPLTEFMSRHTLKSAYPDTWLDLGAVDDIPYALWYRTSVQSLVWYRPTAFEAKGYDIPNSWSALEALSQQIIAEGETPWCIGLEEGNASGATGTDWIEDIVLRTAGPEVYSQWIDHRILFNSPQVIRAFNEFGKLLKDPQYVDGGVEKAIATSSREAALSIFKTPPDCYLHREGSSISSFFPERKRPKVDYDVFPLPGIDPKFGTPLLVAGEAVVMFNDTPASRELMKYFATPTPHEIWAELGGFLSAHKQLSFEAYPDLVTQNIAQILATSDNIRFDASALMPGYVGTEIFGAGVIDFAEGKSVEVVTQEIDNSWP